jgi:carotenoid cleavage dioxygenase-like enzyme
MFGHDFVLSQKMAEVIWKHPIILDAVASEMQRKGDAMMAKWAEIMTCMQPKTYFLRPDIATQLGFAILREYIAQHLFGKPDRYQRKNV